LPSRRYASAKRRVSMDHQIQNARANGMLAAFRHLQDIRVDETRPIDVFSLIEDSGIWLVFQPLKSLWGAYLPGSTPGILINSERPNSVQRLTAAHELGHFVMKHQTSVDGLRNILCRHPFDSRAPNFQTVLREVEAYSFAIAFMTPP